MTIRNNIKKGKSLKLYNNVSYKNSETSYQVEFSHLEGVEEIRSPSLLHHRLDKGPLIQLYYYM